MATDANGGVMIRAASGGDGDGAAADDNDGPDAGTGGAANYDRIMGR